MVIITYVYYCNDKQSLWGLHIRKGGNSNTQMHWLSCNIEMSLDPQWMYNITKLYFQETKLRYKRLLSTITVKLTVKILLSINQHNHVLPGRRHWGLTKCPELSQMFTRVVTDKLNDWSPVVIRSIYQSLNTHGNQLV